ncbi:hypothetical protein [Streptomyces sp. NPDC046942]|uniref:nSTAND1 domain-containing NTPase n=1 Tax=Streptomyces sp. NPDC046942 TaxID=3155137 RepID=UPI0033F1BD03
MGRPEKPLDPGAGLVQRFAHGLRELRRAAGTPSYQAMARTAGFSVTVLSQAAAGKRLPSLAVLQGYVRACGGDAAEWEARWKETEAAAAGAVRDEQTGAPPPYRGLVRFEPDDHHLFFGRGRVVEELKQLVSDHRLAVLFGASGSGKSSLLRAGLIPRLREEIARTGRPAVIRVLTPGARPATTYAHLLAPAEGELESWVVVDQFEEVFTLCRDRAERARFIDLLLAARDPGTRLRVLVAVRADFYARCAEHRGLADALRGSGLLLGPMTADELREVVVKPAQAVGLLVERELTARLVDEVRDEPGGLPMLSHALLETWRRHRGRILTVSAYEAAGGVRGGIAASAEEVYGQLSPAQTRTARHLLLRMVEPGRGTPDTRRPLTWSELDEWADPDASLVVERLARARLLTADEDGVQLGHEALITCWPRLHDWVEEDRERLRHHRSLAEAARVWLEHDRDPGTLYRGARLAHAEELFADQGTLTGPERAFLTAAVQAREAERRSAARTARRSRFLATALSAVLAVALIVGLAAWQQHRDNERQRTESAARRVAEVADALRTTDPRTALLLGVAAWRTAQLPQTRRALLGSLAQRETDTFTDPAPSHTLTRFLAPSGRILLSANGGSWRTWDVSTHRRTGSGRLPQGTIVVASPDTRVLAVRNDDGLRLWDAATGRWTGGAALPATAFVSIGEHAYVSYGTDDDRVELRSLTDGRVLFRIAVPGSTEPSLGADGRLLAVCPSGGSPRVWDTGSHRTLPGGWDHASGVCDDDHSKVVLGAGNRLAAVTDSGVLVWDTASGRQLAQLDDRDVHYAAFSRDGSFLATANAGEIRVWRLTVPGAPVLRYSLNNQRLYGGLSWDPSRPVLRYLEGGTVHTLDLGASVTTSWRARALADVRFSPDGRTYATAERSDSRYVFRLRSTADDRPLRTLPPVPVPVSRDPAAPVVPKDSLPLLAFSPDGGSFVYGVSVPGRETVTQRFTVWDVALGRARSVLDLPGAAVLSLALGPRGRTLYAARMSAVSELSDEVWDIGGHRRTAVLTGMASSHLAVRPDGKLLVGDGRVARLPSRTVDAQELAQGEEIGALGFSADGSLLAVGDETGRVALWDRAVKHRAGVLRNVFPAPLGDTPEAVVAVAVSPDGRTLAVGGGAGSVQLWDVATQQPLGGPLTTPGEAVDSLAFGPDGTTLYAGSAHVPFQRYTIAAARAVTRVCARAGGTGLTEAQWRTYVPDAPYRRLCGE